MSSGRYRVVFWLVYAERYEAVIVQAESIDQAIMRARTLDSSYSHANATVYRAHSQAA